MARKFFDPSTWFGPSRRGLTDRVVRMLNERRYDALADILAEDFVFLDTAGSPIRGREPFLEAMREVHRQAPDIRIEVDEEFEQEGDVLTKGRLVSAEPDYRSESLWRIKFAGDKVSEIQAFRDNNAVSVTRLTAHLRRSPAAS